MIFRGLIYCQEPTISGGFPTMEQYSAQNILQTQPFGMNHFLVGGLEHEFYFPYIGNNHPNWLSYFSGVETTNQFLCSLRFWSDKPCFNFCPWAWTPMVATVVGLESSRIIYSNGFCVKSFRQSLLTTKRGKWIHHLLKSSKRSCHTKTGIDQHQIKKTSWLWITQKNLR